MYRVLQTLPYFTPGLQTIRSSHQVGDLGLMEEGQVGRIGLGWASGPSRKTVLIQTHSSRSVPLEKQRVAWKSTGLNFSSASSLKRFLWPLTLDTQNAALWVCVGGRAGLLLKRKPSKRQPLCGPSFQGSFPLGNPIIWGSQSHQSGMKALFINYGEKK